MQPTTHRATRLAARPSAYVLTALVIGLALGTMNHAHAVLTGPNEVIVQYNLAAGTEVLFNAPVVNQPVHLMATCETLGSRGIACAEILRAPTGPGTFPFIMWTGQNSAISDGGLGTLGSDNVFGFSQDDETLIAKVSFDALVRLEVQNATTMAISNDSGETRAGRVTMLW